tara:strand:+ start:545 stop:988 length:444 start_codon:yes stop_codon:yes gene_type:complete
MGIRKRKTKVAPAPERQQADRSAATRASQQIGGWGTAGALGGGLLGGIAGIPGGIPGILGGAAVGAGIGGQAGSAFGSSLAQDSHADWQVAQSKLDAEREQDLLMLDMAHQRATQDYANRMSALAGAAAVTPAQSGAGFKWGGYLRG